MASELSSPTLLANSVRAPRDQQRAEEPEGDRVRDPSRRVARRRFRVGDHEEEEDEDLGRCDQNEPEAEACDRPEVPPSRHRVAAEREHADPSGERHPERHGDPEQLEPRQDQETARDDDSERDQEPRRHRAPPEVERVGAAAAEDQEAEDEPDVRRVEDVVPSPLDQVLGEDRDRRRPDVDPPAVQAPPVAVLRAGHPQDERDAVSGQEGARGPQEHALLVEGDCHLDHRAGREGDQDLRDRELEPEAHLPDQLQ